jgi:hypothetical protein
MPGRDPPDAESPSCPNCGGRGLARAVEIKGNERTVTYVREACRLRWYLIDEARPPSWARGWPIK